MKRFAIISNEKFSPSSPTDVNQNSDAFYNHRNGFFDEMFDPNKHLYSSLKKAKSVVEMLEDYADVSIVEVNVTYTIGGVLK